MEILIVDDQEGILDIMQHVLDFEGHKVVRAQTIEDALTAARTMNFDVAIIDLTLGSESGISLLVKFRLRCPRMFLIAMSGYVSEYEFVEARRAGAHCVIHKPLTMETVHKVLGCAGNCVECWSEFRNGL